jgi:UDP-N-acetylmuramate dehydrogenase
LIPVYNTENSNYVKTSAAFLIDKVAGMKGLRIKDVGKFENQDLVITNFGSATGEEVLTFAKQIQKEVHEKTSIWLEMEVQMVGF